MSRILEGWQSYERDVVPPTAPNVQREECRRAFYAGAFEMFCRMMEATELSDDGAEQRLTELDQEVRSIVDDLRVK